MEFCTGVFFTENCRENMYFVKNGAVAVILYLRTSMNSHILDQFGRNFYSPGIESRLGRDFRTPSDLHWGPPSLLYIGYRVSFPRLNWAGRGVYHTPPSRAEFKERVELYLYSLWPFMACYGVNFTFTFGRNSVDEICSWCRSAVLSFVQVGTVMTMLYLQVWTIVCPIF